MNHPSDTPEECCPVCFGDGSIDVDDLLKLRAVAQALADMRTLDDWRAGDFLHRDWTMCEAYDYDGLLSHHCCHLAHEDSGKDYAGATPDEARAKAAAWVREQNRG